MAPALTRALAVESSSPPPDGQLVGFICIAGRAGNLLPPPLISPGLGQDLKSHDTSRAGGQQVASHDRKHEKQSRLIRLRAPAPASPPPRRAPPPPPPPPATTTTTTCSFGSFVIHKSRRRPTTIWLAPPANDSRNKWPAQIRPDLALGSSEPCHRWLKRLQREEEEEEEDQSRASGFGFAFSFAFAFATRSGRNTSLNGLAFIQFAPLGRYLLSCLGCAARQVRPIGLAKSTGKWKLLSPGRVGHWETSKFRPASSPGSPAQPSPAQPNGLRPLLIWLANSGSIILSPPSSARASNLDLNDKFRVWRTN